MTYTEAIPFLYGLRLFGLKLGLENTRRLAELAGNPHHRLRFIHVAGTNGKGSTCAMLDSIYRAAGLRVGLFTSPHLVSFRERIQVNRQLIPETDVVRLVGEMQPLLKRFPANHHPTFFEAVTVMALRYFAEQHCDLVIWETGLGGRLDATNIVTPLASVITNIALDHEKWLGETLGKIAGEKAGIIKPRVPVVTGANVAEAAEVIAEVARMREAPLTVVTPDAVNKLLPREIMLSLPGEHQRRNAAVAIAVVRGLQSIIPIPDDDETLRQGLENVVWPGRLQIVQRGQQTLLFDGAHNPAGAEALRAALEKYFPNQIPTFVLGTLADKAWSRLCSILAPLAQRVFLVPVPSQRTASPAELLPAVQKANPRATVVVCGSLGEALPQLQSEPFVVVTGSLYLVGEALEYLGLAEVPAHGERALNEWQTK